CDCQVLLHRCHSSESNQLGYLWSGNPEGDVSSFFSLGVESPENHPSTCLSTLQRLNSPTIGELPGREETKHFILRKLFTAFQPQATVEKDLFSPGLAKNPTPRDPAFVHQLQPWFQSDLYLCF
ncbi:hypothetical protein ILYODFUR_030932, partial [Ilyodon furcidens]